MKKFIAIVFHLKNETFIVYISFISQNLDINHSHRAQKVLLKADEGFISISFKYPNFTNIFSKNQAVKLSEYIRINSKAINLIED